MTLSSQARYFRATMMTSTSRYVIHPGLTNGAMTKLSRLMQNVSRD
jgi:hypothetical protein